MPDNDSTAVPTEAEKIAHAVSEGYPDVDQACTGCGTVFKNYHHFILCDQQDCPMKDGKGTVLEQLIEMNDKEIATTKHLFPHATSTCLPIQQFHIGGRSLCLYYVTERTPSVPYSLYWSDENNPVQHNMSAQEVFSVLAGFLDDVTTVEMQRVVDAARCIRHWHDTVEGGMIVSQEKVFALWKALAEFDAAIALATGGKS